MSNTTTSRAWLLIANGGGRWTMREVCEGMPEEGQKTIENLVYQLGDRGYLRVFQKDEFHDRMRFGVTGDCRIPRGVTAWDLSECLGVRLDPDVDDDVPMDGMRVRDALRSIAAQKVAA